VGLQFLGLDVRGRRNAVPWLADVGTRLGAILAFRQIAHHSWDRVGLRAFNLRQLTFKVSHIRANVNRWRCFGLKDEFTYFFALNSGHRHQKVSEQFVLRSEMSLRTKRTRLLCRLLIFRFLRLNLNRAWCLILLGLLSKLNFSGTCLERTVHNRLKGRGLNILFVVIGFIQNVEGNKSLVFLEQLRLD